VTHRWRKENSNYRSLSKGEWKGRTRRHASQGKAALETAVAAQETLVLETPHRLPDSELAHFLTRSPSWQRNPCSSELLQLRDIGTGAILDLLNGTAADALEDALRMIGTLPGP
jgi:hypothetical protein